MTLSIFLIIVLPITLLLVVLLPKTTAGKPKFYSDSKYFELVRKYSILTGISKARLLTHISIESNFNTNAKNPSDPSYGLMGITSLIGKHYAGVKDFELYNPENNIKAGSYFLKDLDRKYRLSPEHIAEIYNLGETKYNAGLRSPDYRKKFLDRIKFFENIVKK